MELWLLAIRALRISASSHTDPFSRTSVSAGIKGFLIGILILKLIGHSVKMAYKQQGQKVQKVMVQPINLIFRYLQNRSRVNVWLYENVHLRIEGHIIGFDEYMNLVLDDAEEVNLKKGTRSACGRIMLKGDNITVIQSANPETT